MDKHKVKCMDKYKVECAVSTSIKYLSYPFEVYFSEKKAMNDFIAALSAEGGAMQYQPSTAELLGSNPKPGFKGTWNNIEFWQSDSVGKINTNADYSCAMFSKGAFAYTMAPVSAIQSTVPSQNILLDAGQVLVESERDARNGLSSLVAHMYPAVVEADDARACEIVVGV